MMRFPKAVQPALDNTLAKADPSAVCRALYSLDWVIGGTIMSLVAHPSDPAILFSVTRMGQVIGTEDGGKNWQEYPLPEGVGDVYAVACL